MARAIVKTLTTTRVSFKTVVVDGGVPCFVDQPDVVFSGVQDKEKVERLLKARLGKDAVTVITNIDAGQHRYEMSMEDFVLNAQIVDNSEDDDEAEDDGEKPAQPTEDPADRPAQDETADESAPPEDLTESPQETPEVVPSSSVENSEGDFPF